jgi:chemotaxis response regulator CheB
MIRVLVVDDSPTARALLAEILRSDPEVEVIGEAKDGLEGVELTGRLRPDLVTMDVRMPRLDGFAATKEIMIASPTPIVIVTASYDAHEVEVAMQSLRAGALAVLRKPPGPESPAFDEAARKLLGTVKAMSQVKVVRHWRPQSGARGAGRGAQDNQTCAPRPAPRWSPSPPRPAARRRCTACCRGCRPNSPRRSSLCSTTHRGSCTASSPGSTAAAT